jgi:hypothetical protein
MTPQEIEMIIEVVKIVTPYVEKALEIGFEDIEKKYPGLKTRLSGVVSVITAIQHVQATTATK